MRRVRFFTTIFLMLTVFLPTVQAKARRPPLPQEPVTAVKAGRLVPGVFLVQVENIPCLSLRDVQRLVGGRLSWKRLSREVSLSIEGQETSFLLDASTAVVQGRAVPLGSPVRWWTGQAYIPLDFVLSEPFGGFAQATLTWNPDHKVLAVVPVPDISSPRFTSNAGRTRVIFEISARVEGRVIQEREGILVLRLFGGKGGSRERLDVQDPLVTSVDILPRGRSTDVIMNFGPSAERPVVSMEENPRRLIVDVRRGSRSLEEDDPAPADLGEELPSLMPVTALPAEVPEPAQPVTAAEKALLALSPLRVIVVDPGHGGRDVGAVGRRGTLEKDVNLAIAERLVKALKKEGRYDVQMTRDSDKFVSLQDRAEFANKLKANLFISIHCNAALNADSNGFEIYFLSEKATDETAAAVARRENASIDLEGPAGQAKAKVSQLLWSLAKTEDLNESSEMAALVNTHARKKLDLTSRGVKQAGFYVLKWARMPAVLVESAFITNPQEEKLLKNSRFVDKLVGSVVRGIRDYERRKVQARLGDKGEGDGT